jgi:tetratricopeptide (TPR) repeat protein
MLLRNWAEACSHLEVLAQLRPLDPTSFSSLGVCKSYRYDYEGAIMETRRSIGMQATLTVRENLARLELLNGNALEALEQANAVRREKPASLSAQQSTGVSQLVLGRLDGATQTYRTLVTLGGDAEVQGRLGLADIALARGETKQARTELEAAFLAATRQGNGLASGRAAVTLAEVAFASSDLKEFTLQMHRLRDRSNPLLRFLVDRTRLRAGRLADPSELPLKASSNAASADKSLEAILRAEEAMARKDWPKAIQESDQAWSLDPSVLARETQARARASSNPKEAAAFFEDVLRRGAERILVAPDSPGFHKLIEVERELGILLDNLGEKKRSRPHLEAFLALRSVSGLSSKDAVEVTKRLQVP